MKNTFKWFSSILLIIVIFPALGAEQTVQQKIADLEAKLPTVSGREKVDIFVAFQYNTFPFSMTNEE
ncbi:MAG: hypothetical protein GY950_29415 [bacterium]|nr:hypothetical protein [bacterium]